jgi:hypothetical protein
MPGQCGAALSGAASRPQRSIYPQIRGDASFHHLQLADDHGEQIVEVVCNASGQLADGLHLVRLAQLIFGGPALLDFLLELSIGDSELFGFLD